MRTEEEYKKLLEEENIKIKKEKEEFESNPIHWSNNKRRRNGLKPLRGYVNKHRHKSYHFNSSLAFWLIEDAINDILPKKLDEHFDKFMDVKDLII